MKKAYLCILSFLLSIGVLCSTVLANDNIIISFEVPNGWGQLQVVTEELNSLGSSTYFIATHAHIELPDTYTGNIYLDYSFVSGNATHDPRESTIYCNGGRIATSQYTSGTLQIIVPNPVSYIDLYMFDARPSLTSTPFQFTGCRASLTQKDTVEIDRLEDICMYIDGVESSLSTINAKLTQIMSGTQSVTVDSPELDSMLSSLNSIKSYLSSTNSTLLSNIVSQTNLLSQILSAIQTLGNQSEIVEQSSIYFKLLNDVNVPVGNTSTYVRIDDFTYLNGSGNNFTLVSTGTNTGIRCNVDGYITVVGRLYCTSSAAETNSAIRCVITDSNGVSTAVSDSFAQITYTTNAEQLPIFALFEVHEGDVLSLDVRSTKGGFTARMNSNFIAQYMATDNSSATNDLLSQLINIMQTSQSNIQNTIDGIFKYLVVDKNEFGTSVAEVEYNTNIDNIQINIDSVHAIETNILNRYEQYKLQMPTYNIDNKQEYSTEAELFVSVYDDLTSYGQIKTYFGFIAGLLFFLAVLG